VRELIHIGFPKTASTSIQHVFNNHTAITHIGKPRARKDPQVDEVLKYLLAADSRRFEEELPRLRAFLATIPRPETTLVLSEEVISVASFSMRPAIWGITFSVDHETIAARMARLFQDPVVVFVIREQVSLLESFYLQNLRKDVERSDIETWLSNMWTARRVFSLLNHFDYDEVHQVYANALGRDRVRVYVYEQARKDFRGFIEQMFRDHGLPDPEAAGAFAAQTHKNQRSPQEVSTFLLERKYPVLGVGKRFIPQFIKDRLKSRIRQDRPQMTLEWRARIRDHFGPGNARLATRLGLPLETFDYALR
jgi:hypothetical protein